jgi:hypothetical protein
LGGELPAGVDDPSAGGLAGGPQLARGRPGERLGTHRVGHLVSRAQLLAGIEATVLAARPAPMS